MKRGSTPSFSPARKIIQSRSQSPDKGMSTGIVSTRCWAASTTGAITGLKKRPVKLKTKKREIMANGANFAERRWTFLRRFAERNRGAVRGNRGNLIFNSPCERWPVGHQIKTSNLGARGCGLHFSSLATCRCAWPNDFQRTVKHLKSRPILRWRFHCDGCYFLVAISCRCDVLKQAILSHHSSQYLVRFDAFRV